MMNNSNQNITVEKPGKVKLTFKGLWKILKDTGSDFTDCRITRMSAALAYYTIFSIAPVLILIISLSAIFFGRGAIEGSIYHEIKSFVGSDAALQIQELIKKATIKQGNWFASFASIIALVIGATSVFGEIQDSINLIWGLKAKPKRGWIKILLNRLLSFSIIASVSFILLVSLLINTILDIFLGALMPNLISLFPNIGLEAKLAYGINLFITFLIITLLFSIIFKVLPDAKIKWRDVLTGSITTALLFMLGKFAIGFYLGTRNIGNTYGAAGSIILILLWVYYSSIILYGGAAFTKNYAHFKGRRIYPNDYAVWTETVEMEKKGSFENVTTHPIKTGK
ncbi:YihY/virulence factor BrkB family protein [Parafilimonas terrae]|uniref:Membrane protein n=1 Tax=Parafilimonas terrae TaxID=1465490 RepID=A0A1I5WKU8_9BACT|nr:YihY/virulence factor BrkB family protein [Parafilimonas terrae]SFQ20187.1 membrane protein [Parafilimonas terrae]